MSVVWSLYRTAAPWLGAMAPAVKPFLGRAQRDHWDERLGRVAGGPVSTWVHAASLGEAGGVPPLLRELSVRAPGARYHLTATTLAGRERLARAGDSVSLAPLDTPVTVSHFLDRTTPRRLLIVETEVWPHWLIAARARSIGTAFVSARLSARSVRGYRRLGPELRALLSGLAAVLCQSDEDRSRWVSLGVPEDRCETIGNLKNDALPHPVDRAAAKRALGFDADRPLLVIGSARPGELRHLAAAWHALDAETREAWQVVVVPRHPGASEKIKREARRAGLRIAPHDAGRAWHWDDRLGVLRDYYGGADVAFVGGSLEPLGGHHPLEPAALGAAVAIGPYHASQRPAVRALERAGAIPEIREVATALEFLRTLMRDAGERARRAERALDAAAAERGAAARAVERLVALGVWPPS